MIAASKWAQIEPLRTDDLAYDFGEIDSLHQQWTDNRERKEATSPDAYVEFMAQLTRRWAIETGILEGLYTLDRGVTQVLVRRGIEAEYIERGATNVEPQDLVVTLRAHEGAVQLVDQWIEEGRHLSKSLLRMLHSTLTATQDTYRAVDQFGHSFHATLKKGEFKTLPNNPTRPDGQVHEYCPPEQVDSELDALLKWHQEYADENRHPILLAAWLHHRFSQIHPFQDGNGRVARALVTWQLARDRLLPIVVSRENREDYIDALEKADEGDMKPLVNLFVRLEKASIMQALGAATVESEPAEIPTLVDQIIGGIADKVHGRKEAEEEQLREVNTVAVALRERAHGFLAEKAAGLREAGLDVDPRLDLGGPDGNEHWYKAQVTRTAQEAHQWVNFNENRYLVKLSVNPGPFFRGPRLVFVVSLHHVGRQLSGVMAATSFAEIQYYGEDEDTEPTFVDCSVSPFTFRWKDNVEAISETFITWLEECLSIALKEWGDLL